MIKTKIIFIFIVFIILSFNANAGILSKTAKTGATYAFIKFAVPAITRGTGKKVAGMALKKLKSKSFTHFTESMAVLTFIAVGNEAYKENIKHIMASAGVLTDEISFKIDEESLEFSKAKALFTAEANKIDKNYKRKSCDTYKNLITDSGYPSDPNYIHNPVREFDVGSFASLYKNAITGDSLEHDHVPSKQAVKNFLIKKGYIKSDDFENNVDNNSTAIEVSTVNHIKGATYGGKQNTKINGMAKNFFDSEDLRVATIRDMSYHYINYRNSKVIKAFFPLYKRNLELCLYN